ncbi:MAG: hypothetical protein BWX79_01898 [Alphaproteobacteria bacterium ADurb.Bin100]|nr:MAG: hypothetical protein BWX79_01898 [Alphaproteobacteria bacterium ADurb.Bin100]
MQAGQCGWVRVHTRNRHEVHVVDRELAVAVHEVDAAAARPVHRRNVELHHFHADRHRPGAALQRAPVGRGRVTHPQCHGGDDRLVVQRAALPCATPMGIDDDIDAALAVQQHLARAVPRDRAKAQRLQHLAQGLGPGGGVFDEFDAFHAQRVGRLVDRFAVVCFRHGESFWAGPNAAASAAGTSGPGERTPRTVGCGRNKTNQLFTFRSIIDRFQGYPPRPAPTLRPPCRP